MYHWILFCPPFATADPKGVELALPDCSEDKEIVPLKTYYGGKEGIGKYVWYRTKEKLPESELVNIASSDDVCVVGEMLWVFWLQLLVIL